MSHWKARRLELIEKKYDDGLTDAEQDELEKLNAKTDRAINQKFHDDHKLKAMEEAILSDDE